MADIDSIIAGVSGNTRADFANFDPVKGFFDANKQRSEFDLRRAFKPTDDNPNGLPMQNGQLDYPAMVKTLIQKGGLEQGLAVAKLAQEQQNLAAAQRTSGIINGDAPIVSPSMSRQASTPDIAPRNQGGQTSQVAPQGGGGQPKTVMELAMSKGMNNYDAGRLSERLKGSNGIGPNGEIDFSNQQARNLVTSALQYELKNNAQPDQSNAPMVQPQGQPQAQPQVAQQQAPAQAIQTRPQPQQPAPNFNSRYGAAFHGDDPTLGGLIPAGRDAPTFIRQLSQAMDTPGMPPSQVANYKARLEAIYKAIGQDRTDEATTQRQELADKNKTQLQVLEKSIIPRIDKSKENAEAARADIEAIHNSRAELDRKGGIISGAFADNKLLFAKVAHSLGIQDADKIQNTEAFQAAIGGRVAAIVKAFGSGNGVSNSDREYAAGVSGGNFKLDETSIRRILDIGEKVSRAKLDRHNSDVDKFVKANDGLKPSRDTFLVKAPDDYNAPLSKARRAIENGAPRDAVIKRLRDAGHNPAGL